MIVRYEDKLVEIQVRTALQHAWAELSEKLSDLVDPAIKYGGGDPKNQEVLKEYSGLIADEEAFESELVRDRNDLSVLLSRDSLTKEEQDAVLASRKRAERTEQSVLSIRERILAILRTAIDNLPTRKR